VINDDIYRSFESSLFLAGLDTSPNSSHVQQLNKRRRQKKQQS
jgi:hypothetical protein